MAVHAINVKPIIRELVRTKVCFPDLQLLVDRLSIFRSPSSDVAKETKAGYILYLTDREKTIQAVIKSRLHRRINRGEIREGSIVVLKDYELACKKRLNGDGKVLFLKIADFFPIGEEERPSRPAAILGADAAATEQKSQNAAHEPSTVEDDQPNNDLVPTHCAKDELPPHPSPQNPSTTHHPDPAASSDQPNPPAPATDPKSTHQPTSLPPRSRKRKRSSPTPPPLLPPPPSPLTLTPLSALTPPTPSQTTHPHTILALITHVSPTTTKPPNMPRKRDLRVMDTSTEKQVLLSVFVDPVGFCPVVGTIAVMEGLVAHAWDGGNLKKYPWVGGERGWWRVVDGGEGGLEGRGGVEGLEEGLEEGLMEGLRGLRDRVLGSAKGARDER